MNDSLFFGALIVSVASMFLLQSFPWGLFVFGGFFVFGGLLDYFKG